MKKISRLFNGKRLNIDLDPNSFPEQIRIQKAKLLCAEVYKYLSKGNWLKVEVAFDNVFILSNVTLYFYGRIPKKYLQK